MALEVFLRNDPERPVFDPFALLHRDARPAHAADAVDFLALDRDQHFAAPGIAADQLELGAEYVDEQDRHFTQRRAFAAGADDHFLAEHFLEALGGSIAAQHAEIDAVAVPLPSMMNFDGSCGTG